MPVNIILVNSREIKKLNRRWFGLWRATDVIAFPPDEIYICVPTAKKQARERGVSLELELLRLAVHGFAHIEGYDDDNLKNFCRMRQREWEMLIKCVSL